MPKAPPAKKQSLDEIYIALEKLASRFVPPLKSGGAAVPGKRHAHFVIPRAVSVPGAYGGRPVELEVASLILQKDYVGFYCMPVYMNAQLRAKLSPALLKLLKGKTCFHVKQLDPALTKDIETAIQEGIAFYKSRGWL